MSGLPADRVADAWASADGVRRLLAPQGGVLGAAGVLLDQPGLKGAGVGLVAHDKGARIVVRSELDPKAQAPADVQAVRADAAGADAQGRARLPGRERALHRDQPRARRRRAADRRPGRAAARAGRQLDQQSGRPADAGGARGAAAARSRSRSPPPSRRPSLTVVAHAKKDTAGRSPQLEVADRAAARQERALPGRRASAGTRLGVLKAGPITIVYAVSTTGW